MDIKTVRALSQVLNDSFNKRLKREDAKQKINRILHNKSYSTVIRELSEYISSRSGKEKNFATVIVIMAVLMRNLDIVQEVKAAVEQYRLVGQLYGGLYTLFSGDSELLTIKANLTDSRFENKYDYLMRFDDFYYWDCIDLFQAVEVLSLADSEKFERLALMDKTKLILLNMASGRLRAEPSKDLIVKLLQDEDELKQNIGFFFITRKVIKCLNEINYIERAERFGNFHGKSKRSILRELKTELKECLTFLENCDKQTQAALLTNFLLVNQNAYPTIFARELVGSKLQDEFINQISNTGKIKTLNDVVFFIGLISDTPAINENKKRISKIKLYMAMVNILVSFIDNNNGIYGWYEQQRKYIEYIYQRLPSRCVKKLKTYLTNKERKLMTNKLDELVRFQIYLKDKRQQEIISGILSVITPSTV